MIKTVMFDLDDTIFDHKYSRQCALRMLQNDNQRFSEIPIEALEQAHGKLLQMNNKKILHGSLSIEESRQQIIYDLFKLFDIFLPAEKVREYSALSTSVYEKNHRPIPGVNALIDSLSSRVKIGIVSNGPHDIQVEKLDICRVADQIDFYIFSGDIKFMKPDPAIFEAALTKGKSKPEETIFIGDSWGADIVGATNLGIKAIWLSRYGQPCPDNNLALEINSYENPQSILDHIFC